MKVVQYNNRRKVFNRFFIVNAINLLTKFASAELKRFSAIFVE